MKGDSNAFISRTPAATLRQICLCRDNESAANRCNAWDAAWAGALARLREHEDAVQAAVTTAFDALEGECLGYGGYPADELHRLLGNECAEAMATRQQAAAKLLDRTQTLLATQAAEWRHIVTRVGAFRTACTADVESHAQACKDLETGIRRTLKRMRADAETAGLTREAALTAAMEAVARAAHESELDDSVAGALVRLAEIEEGYRSAFDEQLAVARAHPEAVNRLHDAFHRHICGRFALVPNVPIVDEVHTGSDAPAANEWALAPEGSGDTAAMLPPLQVPPHAWARTHRLLEALLRRDDAPAEGDSAMPALASPDATANTEVRQHHSCAGLRC